MEDMKNWIEWIDPEDQVSESGDDKLMQDVSDYCEDFDCEFDKLEYMYNYHFDSCMVDNKWKTFKTWFYEWYEEE